jgi:hypothetical protein
MDFYEPRGWIMSMMARLRDPTLVFYDPIESAFTSQVLHGIPSNVRFEGGGLDASRGGSIDGGTVFIPVDGAINVPWSTDETGKQPLFSLAEGSVSVWIKADLSRNASSRVIAELAGSESNAFRLEISRSDKLAFFLSDKHGKKVEINAPIARHWRTQQWNHVAVSWNQSAGRLALFLNGVKLASKNDIWASGLREAEVSDLAQRSVILGNDKDGQSGLIGFLDEIRIYRREITAADVKILFTAYMASNR